ncbi:MAG: lyase [Nitrospirota bacterium]
MKTRTSIVAAAVLVLATTGSRADDQPIREYPVPKGSHPHDVAPAADGGVWYTAQHQGALGYLDPKTGKTRHIPLGEDSAPHGVIVGPDGAPWITDSGMNAIVRVDPKTDKVTTYPLPIKQNVNLNTATFDRAGTLWFTGQSGYYGRVAPKTGKVEAFEAPRGRGPYGICTAPDGSVWYASLAGSHIAKIDTTTGEATVIDPPTRGRGARRVWADSKNRVWVSEWNAGQVAVYDPKTNQWREWKLPGKGPQTYAVFVDDKDMVWLSDFGNDVIIRFDPTTEQFSTFHLPTRDARVRQILGRPGEVWLPESGTDQVAVIHTSS